MRWVPGLKSFNLNDFITLGVVRERFGYGESGSGKFLLFFGCPDGFGSSDFAQNVDLFMLYRSIWVSGADFIKNIYFKQRKGRILRIWARTNNKKWFTFFVWRYRI